MLGTQVTGPMGTMCDPLIPYLQTPERDVCMWGFVHLNISEGNQTLPKSHIFQAEAELSDDSLASDPLHNNMSVSQTHSMVILRKQ